MNSEITPPKFARLHRPFSRANESPNSRLVMERQSPSQIRALARSALEERPPRPAEEAVASRLKRKFRLDNVDLRESSSKSEGRLEKVDSEVGINDKDKGSFRIIGFGGLSTGKTKEERIASIARRGLFPDERQRLPKKKSPVKKKLQSHSPGNDIMTNELSLFESTATADVTAIFAAHDSKNQIGTFASTNFSGLSSSLKSNVYMSSLRSYTPPPRGSAFIKSTSDLVQSPVRGYIEDVYRPERLPETSSGWLHVCIDGVWTECHTTADVHSKTLLLNGTGGLVDVIHLKGMKASQAGRIMIKQDEMHAFKLVPSSQRIAIGNKMMFAASDYNLAVSWIATLNGASGHAEYVEKVRAEQIAEEKDRIKREQEDKNMKKYCLRPLSPPNVDISSLIPLPPPVRSFYAEQYEEEQRSQRTKLDRFVAVRRLQAWWRGVVVRRFATKIFWRQIYKKNAFRCARERAERLAASRIQKWTRFIVISSAQKERYRAALHRAFTIQANELSNSPFLIRLRYFSTDSVEWMASYPLHLWSTLHALLLKLNDVSLRSLSKPQQSKLMELFDYILPEAPTILRDHHGSHCKQKNCRLIGCSKCIFPTAPRRLVRLANVASQLHEGIQGLAEGRIFLPGIFDLLASIEDGALQHAVEGYLNIARNGTKSSFRGLQGGPAELNVSTEDNHSDFIDGNRAISLAEQSARQRLRRAAQSSVDDKGQSVDLNFAYSALSLSIILLEFGFKKTFEAAILIRKAASVFQVWVRGMLFWEQKLKGRIFEAWKGALSMHKRWRKWGDRLERLFVVESLGDWFYMHQRAASMCLRRAMRTWFGNGRLMARERESLERAECFWEGVAAAQAVDLLYLSAYESQKRLTMLSEELLSIRKRRLLVRWAAELRHNSTLRHRAEIRLRKFFEEWLNVMSILLHEKRSAVVLQAFLRGRLVLNRFQQVTEKRFRIFVSSCSDDRRVIHRSHMWYGHALIIIESGLAHAGRQICSLQWLGCPALWLKCTDHFSMRSSMHHITIGGLMRFASSAELHRPITFGCLIRKLARSIDWLSSDHYMGNYINNSLRPILCDGAPQKWSFATEVLDAQTETAAKCKEAKCQEDEHILTLERVEIELTDASRYLKSETLKICSTIGDKLYKEVREICFFEDILKGHERARHRKPLGREEWTYAGPWTKRRELQTIDMHALRVLLTNMSIKYKEIVDTIRMMRRRRRLWILLSRDASFVRHSLVTSLDENLTHMKDMADAALAYCRDAFSAVCCGATTKRLESMHRCDSIREKTFHLLNMQKSGIEKLQIVMENQMKALSRDKQHIDSLTKPLISGVSSYLEHARKDVQGIMQHYTNRNLIIAEVAAECRREYAERMLKLYSPAKKIKQFKPYVPKPPKKKWEGIRSLPPKYVPVYQDLVKRGPKPKKTSRQRWEIVRDKAQHVTLVMDRFVNAVKSRTELTIKPSTLMKMSMALKSVRDTTKAMSQNNILQAKSTILKFQIFERKVKELQTAFSDVFDADDNKETRLLTQALAEMPFILEKLDFVARFPDKTAAPQKQKMSVRRASLFGGKGLLSQRAGEEQEDGSDDEEDATLSIGNALRSLRASTIGKPKWKHPKHILTDTSFRSVFITIDQKENAAAILMQAAARRILYLKSTRRSYERHTAIKLQCAMRQRLAYRKLNGRRICRFVEGRKEYEQKLRNMAAFHRGVHRIIAGERKQFKRGHKRFIKIYKDPRGKGQTYYLDMETWTYREDKPGHFRGRLDLPSPRSRRRRHRELSVNRLHMTEVEAAHVIQRLLDPLIQRDERGYLPSQYPGFFLRGPRAITLEKAALLVQSAWTQREEWKYEARRRNVFWRLYK